MNFAEELKKYRKAKKITQEEFSKTVGVPKRTLEEWERGASAPKDYMQNIIIEYINYYYQICTEIKKEEERAKVEKRTK